MDVNDFLDNPATDITFSGKTIRVASEGRTAYVDLPVDVGALLDALDADPQARQIQSALDEAEEQGDAAWFSLLMDALEKRAEEVGMALLKREQQP